MLYSQNLVWCLACDSNPYYVSVKEINRLQFSLGNISKVRIQTQVYSSKSTV